MMYHSASNNVNHPFHTVFTHPNPAAVACNARTNAIIATATATAPATAVPTAAAPLPRTIDLFPCGGAAAPFRHHEAHWRNLHINNGFISAIPASPSTIPRDDAIPTCHAPDSSAVGEASMPTSCARQRPTVGIPHAAFPPHALHGGTCTENAQHASASVSASAQAQTHECGHNNVAAHAFASLPGRVCTDVVGVSPYFLADMTMDTFIKVCSDWLDRKAAPHCRMHRFSPVLPSHTEPKCVFFSVSKPEFATREYIRRLVTHAQCSPSAFVLMLVYLDRVVARQHWLRLSPYNLHRLVITALLLACKMMEDECFPNTHFAKLGGIPSVREMNRLEMQFLHYIHFECYVTREDFSAKLEELKLLPAPKPSPSIFELAVRAPVALRKTAAAAVRGCGDGGSGITSTTELEAAARGKKERDPLLYSSFPHPLHSAGACSSATTAKTAMKGRATTSAHMFGLMNHGAAGNSGQRNGLQMAASGHGPTRAKESVWSVGGAYGRGGGDREPLRKPDVQKAVKSPRSLFDHVASVPVSCIRGRGVPFPDGRSPAARGRTGGCDSGVGRRNRVPVRRALFVSRSVWGPDGAYGHGRGKSGVEGFCSSAGGNRG